MQEPAPEYNLGNRTFQRRSLITGPMTQPRGFNFTDAVRRALGQARTEAAMLHYEYVGTEHILLGLIAVGPNLATRIIEESGGQLGPLRDTVLRIVKRGSGTPRNDPSLPFSSRAKKVLELAMEEASDLAHDSIGTQHALLGLIREKKWRRRAGPGGRRDRARPGARKGPPAAY